MSFFTASNAWLYLVALLLLLLVAGYSLLRHRTLAKTTLGIDVGNAQIKIAELSVGRRPALLRYAIVPTPPDAVHNGVVKDGEALVLVIADAIASAGFRSRRCTAVLTGQNLLLRHIELPAMPTAELRQAIKWQFEQFFQIRLAEMLTDYQVISAGPGQPSTVLLVAMQREPIMSLVDHLRRAGLVVLGVDIESLAVQRAIGLTQGAEKTKITEAAVDFGAGTTNVSIYHQGLLQASRILNIGGNDFTSAIATYFDLDRDAAEALKLRHGLATASEIGPAVAAVRDRLFGEIYKTLDFYFTEHREQKLAKLTIVGGGSNMAGLAVQIDHFLGENQAMLLDTFSVELLNPLHFVEHKLGEEEAKLLGPALAVAIGLALEEVVTR